VQSAIPDKLLAIVNSFTWPALDDVYYGSATVAVLLGNGNGTFQGPVEANVGAPDTLGFGFGLAAAELNGDNNLDLAVSNSEDGNVYVLLGNGNGSFESLAPIDGVGGIPAGVVAGKFHGGNAEDLAVVSEYDGCTPTVCPGEVSVLLGNGDGTFNLT